MYQVYTLLTLDSDLLKIQKMPKKSEKIVTVTAKYARRNFSEILNEVHFGRKKIVITRSGKPLVVLTSTKDLDSKEKND